jgi:hypothetical protein
MGLHARDTGLSAQSVGSAKAQLKFMTIHIALSLGMQPLPSLKQIQIFSNSNGIARSNIINQTVLCDARKIGDRLIDG